MHKLNERRKIALDARACFTCLKDNHLAKECRSSHGCPVESCEGRHHELLQEWKRAAEKQESDSAIVTSVSGHQAGAYLGVFPVTLPGAHEVKVEMPNIIALRPSG